MGDEAFEQSLKEEQGEGWHEEVCTHTVHSQRQAEPRAWGASTGEPRGVGKC